MWPDEHTGAFWVGPVVTVVLVFALWRLGQLMTTRISFDILENCDVSCMKDSVKNNWTNMAVTAALLLSMTVAMLQVDAAESVDFEIDVAIRVHLRQFYVCFCLGSACCNLVAIFYCIIYLSFVDPLSPTDCMKYLLTYPDSLGDPVVWLLEGVIFFWLSACVWSFCAYGGMQLLVCLMFFIFFVGNIVWTAVTRSSFCPGEMEWGWTQQDPSTWKEHQTYANRNLSKNKAIKTQVQRIGRMIVEAEEQTKKSQYPLSL